MAERTRSLEIKVGIFVFAGICVLSLFVLLIGDLKFMQKGFKFDVTFGFANGIKVGAPVRVAGVDKGEVKDVELTHDGEGSSRVVISVWVNADTLVPVDSRGWVNTLGLMGEKYLEIIPGSNYKHFLKEGSVLVGEDPISIQEVTDLVNDVALKAETMIDSLNGVLSGINEGKGTVGKLFQDESLYENIDEMFADLKAHPWKLLFRPKDAK